MSRFTVRKATVDDVEAMASLLAAAYDGRLDLFPAYPRLDAETLTLLGQTGHDFLVATTAGGRLVGVVRSWHDDGVAWFDLLASSIAGGGRALVRAVERLAQDAGLRVVRTNVPGALGLPDLFQAWGYTPVSRAAAGEGAGTLILERRVPLLTIRAQRRDDASAIVALIGGDPFPLEREARPGWFVAADGDRVVGVIFVRDGGRGLALVAEPVLREGYAGRRLELWMIDHAARFAGTRGYHTAELPATPATDALQRDLEDRRWFREGAGPAARYVRRLETPGGEGARQPESDL